MNIQKIKSRMGRGLAGIVLGAGLVVGTNGCSTYGDAFAANLAETALTTAMVSTIENEIEGPRGATVNVYNGAQTTPQYQIQPTRNTEKRIDEYFICNRLNDMDNNGSIDSDEIIGKDRRVFSLYERVTCVINSHGYKGHLFQVKILNEDNKIITAGEEIIGNNYGYSCLGSQTNELGRGKYKAKYNLDEECIGWETFEVD